MKALATLAVIGMFLVSGCAHRKPCDSKSRKCDSAKSCELKGKKCDNSKSCELKKDKKKSCCSEAQN